MKGVRIPPWWRLINRLSLVLAALAFSLALPGMAAPHRPATDTEIVARLPNGEQLRQLAPLRDAVRERPDDASAAVALAQAYVRTAHLRDDPRLMGYALSTLEPWLSEARTTPEVLLLAADATQYLHQFDRALGYLDRSLARSPSAQAQLMRADLLEVRGELPSARQACAHLAQLAAHEIAIACLTSVASRTGELRRSFDTLSGLHAASKPLPVEIDVWIRTILADMADRLGDGAAQGRLLQGALERASADVKVKAAYADWLLGQGRSAEVVALLRDDEQYEGLLLRLAIAASAGGTDEGEARRLAAQFREREALAVGESRHLRERARFLLDVEHSPTLAARVALENWNIQREPADVRLLVRAARQSHDAAALRVAQAWIDGHRYEDASLE